VQHFGPVYAAHQGLYNDVGLQVDVQPGGQADPLQLLAAGNVDIVVSGPTQIYVANEQGLNVVGFAAVFQKSPQVMVCRGDRGITTFQDLAGKTIGSKGPPDMDTLPPLLSKNGLDVSKVKITPIGGNSVTEIIAGIVDCQLAYATNEPIIMQKAGITPVVFYLADLGFGGQAEVYVTRADYLAQNPDVLKRFLQATGKAWGTLLDDPESAGQWVVDSQIVDGLDVDEQRQEAVAQVAMIADDYTQQHGLLAINPDLWQQQARQALDQGRISQPPDMTKEYTLSILDAAALPHR
jgi:NitT/TauT family transport system substrate-binding protein